jgi:hypothetical protein
MRHHADLRLPVRRKLQQNRVVGAEGGAKRTRFGWSGYFFSLTDNYPTACNGVLTQFHARFLIHSVTFERFL